VHILEQKAFWNHQCYELLLIKGRHTEALAPIDNIKLADIFHLNIQENETHHLP
jgi:hypothetical protein